MGLVEDFKVNLISEQRQAYEIKVRTKGSARWVDLPDIGFGVLQVLPVLVQCFYAPKGSIIILEHPESCLHPSAQSVLADVMVDAIRSRGVQVTSPRPKGRGFMLHRLQPLDEVLRSYAASTCRDDRPAVFNLKLFAFK